MLGRRWGIAAACLLGVGLLLAAGCGGGNDDETYAPTWDPPEVDRAIADLEGLPFDEFVELSYELHLLRHPENLTHLGMARELGVAHDRLNDDSEAYARETQRLESAILGQLRSYDRATLSGPQQHVYDVCEWFWEDRVRALPYLNHDYPISAFFVTSRHYQIYDLLTERHPLQSVADAEDYVRRLRQVGATFDRVIEGLERRAAAGIVVPDGLLDGAIDNIWRMKEASGTNHPYNARLSEALEGADWIDRGTRSRLIGAASRAVRDVVTPAYERLYDAATGLRDATPTDHGVWQYPDGDGYYAYLLHHYTGTDLTAEEIHEIGLREVARLRDGIREASAFLGLTDDVPFSSIFGHTARSSGSLYGAAILEEYQRLIRYAQQGVVGVFGRLPETEVAVEGHEAGGYYVPAPRDGSSPGTFYAADRGQQAVYRMPNLTYHETVPGHHLQIALAQELDLPLLLSEETFLGFSEGWALYAERLAWELGWYDDDPHGNLGRLQDEMMRAVRLVVDTGLHIKGWPFYEAVDYFVENTGRARGEAQYNIMRYSAWPGQATAYMIGMLEILDQRERAKSALGEEFDLAAFHDAVLERGNIPLSMLDGIVSEFIEHQLSGS